MRLTIGPTLLAIALLGGAGVALFQRSGSAGGSREHPVALKPNDTSTPGGESFETTAPHSDVLPPNHPSIGGAAGISAEQNPLPPNHPAIGASSGDRFAAPDAAAALVWTAPSEWEIAPNRSTMRLATYRVPAAAKGGAGAELTVSRAGGTTAENLQRWVDQFDGSGKEARTARTIAGFHVTTLDVSGTYDGAMSSTGPEATHPGWSLLAAVVETTGPSYFFKMVGPSEDVHAARSAFDALIGSVRAPS